MLRWFMKMLSEFDTENVIYGLVNKDFGETFGPTFSYIFKYLQQFINLF